MTHCNALEDTALNERNIKLLVFKMLSCLFFFFSPAVCGPFNGLTVGLFRKQPCWGCHVDASG